MKNRRPRSPNGAYGRELGLTGKVARKVGLLGGAEYLRSLSPESRAILLAPLGNGNSRTVADGGLIARGMRRRTAAGLPPREEMSDDFLIPPHVEFDGPMEALLSEEDMSEVEGLGEFDEA